MRKSFPAVCALQRQYHSAMQPSRAACPDNVGSALQNTLHCRQFIDCVHCSRRPVLQPRCVRMRCPTAGWLAGGRAECRSGRNVNIARYVRTHVFVYVCIYCTCLPAGRYVYTSSLVRKLLLLLLHFALSLCFIADVI